MNSTFIKPKLDGCHCICHHEECMQNMVPDCTNLNLNKSQIISEPVKTINNHLSFNYNYDNPLFLSQKDNEIEQELNNRYSKQEILFNQVKNEIEKDSLNLSKNYDIRERAKAIKEKIDSIFLLKKMYNKSMKQGLNIRNNIENNDNILTPKFTFYENFNYNKKDRASFDKKQFENKISVENPRLKRLLSNVPRHEKNRSGKRQTDEKAKLLFTNGLYRMKSFDAKNIMSNKKFTGYASMIMPPNNISKFSFSNKN